MSVMPIFMTILWKYLKMELRKNENEPIYDDKVKNVIRLLTEGVNREEIAKQMGYSNYKSLDMYVRRRNFHWDSDNQNYVPNYNRFAAVCPSSNNATEEQREIS